ncbi:hypothetical protein BRADI_1g19285v3 [Brachypodium distachyon]|uniref:Uncharacterized protein n=1 Tax=Brachypodium distachyon TaxID=15368 RepID=A0A2K2DK42_BRADI|nr:hypothetical protein BRADI_1g19285v3 [Brachypodium distachyon]
MSAAGPGRAEELTHGHASKKIKPCPGHGRHHRHSPDPSLLHLPSTAGSLLQEIAGTRRRAEIEWPNSSGGYLNAQAQPGWTGGPCPGCRKAGRCPCPQQYTRPSLAPSRCRAPQQSPRTAARLPPRASAATPPHPALPSAQPPSSSSSSRERRPPSLPRFLAPSPLARLPPRASASAAGWSPL